MKKIIQRLSLILAVIVVIPLSIMAISASVKNEIEAEKNQNEQSKDPNGGDENNPESSKGIVNGYYHFESDVNEITWFVDSSVIYEYFGVRTNDFNSLMLALRDKGFNQFAKNIKYFEDKEKFIKFTDNSQASSYVIENDKYALVNEDEYIFYYVDSVFVTSGTNPLIESNAEDKTVTLYFPFYYENDEGETVVTPLYVKATLSYVEE